MVISSDGDHRDLHIEALSFHTRPSSALGLRHIGDVTTQPDNAATRGKIASIGYLLQVTENA